MKPARLDFFRGLSLVLFGIIIGLVAYFLIAQVGAQRVIVREGGTGAKLASLPSYPLSGLQGKFWIADLAEKSLPFVVNIKVESNPPKVSNAPRFKQFQSPDSGQDMPGAPGDELHKFFQFQFPDIPDISQMVPPSPRRGEGSGFVISPDGKIVTNEHVVAGANKITVTLNSGKTYPAKLLGTDMMKDIAVIKIDADGLPCATLGDSDSLRPGEPAIAIGSPLGLEHTVTAGIVSAVGRKPSEIGEPGQSADDPRGISNLIQTDAAINQGNSGGPLLNYKGEVIGVNQAIIPYAERIGFAIAINAVKASIDEIIKHGRVVYPGLSIHIRDVTADLAKEAGLSAKEGVYVQDVEKGGAADRGGIKAGDVITAIDGAPVKDASQLIRIIMAHKVRDKVILTVAPQGGTRRVDHAVVLGELKGDFQ
jgi:S1-C subfamily serine protease